MLTDEERSALDAKIAATWPNAWGKANTGTRTAKKRSNLRKRWIAEENYSAFKTANPEAKCSNCKEFGTMPPGLKGNCCDMKSDYWGYTHAEPDGLCVHWVSMHKTREAT